ncbi:MULTISPECIES: type II secretion system F family protein [Caloramator]|uniref:Type IV pilus assembly protein PilC n=1 Tax=Caloramator proteoclasticus DSM 10124 TaxID=1121262 RepID=A0A1M4ZKM0_9CLOT|nr:MULTISPECIES: type II secretion system F family protein [Caloramator]SHF18544.1 type IV pilus assembly protein PilC [Caloramator proteoclasticus DSM 10124]
MANYVYEAIDVNGKKIKGKIVAEDRQDAQRQLKDKNLYIVDINEDNVLNKEINIKFLNKVKAKDLAVFCKQVATLLQAGLNILTCLNVIKNQITNKKLKNAVISLSEDVEKGTAISASMRRFPDVFPEILINMIEAGEVGGSLDNSFEKMAVQFEKEMKLKQKITNALMYPAIVIFVALAVLNLLLIFVIPTFVGMFNDLGVELPPTTRFILNASTFMKNNWLILIALIVLLIILINYYKKTPSGSIYFSSLRLKMPIIGKISLFSSIARFTRTLSTLVSSGVPLVTAIETTKNLLSNAYIEEKFEGVVEQVRGGEGLSRPIEALNIFPELVPVMIKTGEESGTLEEMLSKLADLYENEVENMVTRLTAVFEPIMIVFLALIVGFMLASIILPMFKLYGNMNL